jgi:hypothetical protein
MGGGRHCRVDEGSTNVEMAWACNKKKSRKASHLTHYGDKNGNSGKGRPKKDCMGCVRKIYSFTVRLQ